MITPRFRSVVSLAAALTVSLGLGACASTASRPARDVPAPVEGVPLAIRFDNFARDYVHVYLVGERREWMLGRVEAGGRSTLRVPRAALAEAPGSMRLAVLVGQRRSPRAAAEGRATTTLGQPASEIVSQRWTFSQTQTAGQLTGVWLPRTRTQLGQR